MKLLTLGGLKLDGANLTRVKPLLLLTYVTIEGSRDRHYLAELFWPDAADPLNSLAAALKQLRHYAPGVVESDTVRVSSTVECDAPNFLQVVETGDYGRALKLYQGPFLSGNYLKGWSAELEEWVYGTREFLAGRARNALLRLGEQAAASGEFAEASRRAEAAYLLAGASEPEPAELRRLYTLLVAGGSAHLARFRKETQGLGLEIALSAEQARGRLQEQPNITPSVFLRLPSKATSFVGRDAERAEVANLLARPDCSLLTLSGPGGIGKTRLAIEVANKQLGRFGDGVYFVGFASVNSPDRMVFAIADALGLSFSGRCAPEAQLLEYLQDKEMLLLLDNLEHLLSGANHISDLLAHAPNVKVLATSRERLNLHAEWVIDLAGLSVPETGEEGACEYDAVKLFAQRAIHARSDFAINEATLPAAVRICQLVQGLPLALELAANWLRALTLKDIAVELEKGIDLLEASTRDIPARHRSIRAVFDYSWDLLTDNEKAVLRELAVFQSGFRREAAVEVVGANLPMLARLVDKSFLTITPTGRYRRHPLVLQYTLEKLSEYPEEKARVQEKHSLYYLHFIRERHKKLSTDRETFEAVEEELPNIRAAWQWALENERFSGIKAAAFALGDTFMNRVAEGERFFAQAVAALDATNSEHQGALGYVLLARSSELLELARYEESAACAERSLELLRPLDDTQGTLRAQFLLGVNRWILGDFTQARALLKEGLDLSRAYPEFHSTEAFINYLVLVEREFGTFSQVKQLFEEVLAEAKQVNDVWILATVKHEYGAYLAQYDLLDEGESFVREGLRLLRSFNQTRMEGYFLVNLALVTSKLGKYDEAEALALDALTLAEQLTLRDVTAKAWERLGRVAVARGRYSEAQGYLKESLKVAWAWAHPFSVLDALIRLSELYIAQGKAVRATEWLGLVQHQRGYLNEHKLEVDRLLKGVRKQLREREVDKAIARGKEMKLGEVVPQLLVAL